MIALFKSRKSAMCLIGIAVLTVLSIVNGNDVTNQIVTLIGLYFTGNVVQKATRKDIEVEE